MMADIIAFPPQIPDFVAVQAGSGEVITVYPSHIGAVVDIFDTNETNEEMNRTIDAMMSPPELRQLAAALVEAAEFAERLSGVVAVPVVGVVG
jgi:hypothetical protein